MNKFDEILEEYRDTPVALAVSGGADSMYLMHRATAVLRRAHVLHVNHGLRDAATAEAAMVAKTAAALSLPCAILNWDGDKPAAGLEAAARDARYELMTDWCKENGVAVLFVAHQSDDQIETFLLHLARGSGVYGLAGIRRETTRGGIKIVRPMLSISRDEINAYCADNKISFAEDEMNDEEVFFRVKIRKNRGLLRDKLGISDQRILLAIENLSRVREALEEQVEKLTNAALIPEPRLTRLRFAPPRQAIHSSSLRSAEASDSPVFASLRQGKRLGKAVFSESFLFDLPDEIRLKLLSELVRKIGKAEYPPRLEKIIFALEKLRGDCKFSLGHCGIRRLGDKIIIAPQGESLSFRNSSVKY
jgi:tRNA(Ile)-lysidine synthase